MTITPQQAQALRQGISPGKWRHDGLPRPGEDPMRATEIYSTDEYGVIAYVQPCKADADAIALVPDMAEQIAGMEWEYAPQTHLDGTWKYVTGVVWKVNGNYDISTSRTATGALWFEDPDEVREACEELDVATYRIVRRLVGEPEMID